jgi:hypothetical protein
MHNSVEPHLSVFYSKLRALNVYLIEFHPLYFQCRYKSHALNCEIIKEKSQNFKEKTDIYFALHDIVHQPAKCIAILKSKLGLNRKIFARNCIVTKINQIEGSAFVHSYHLLDKVTYSYYVGLKYLDELIAVAAFSKGRKLNRLKADERSYELIRFCCKDGYTITGGLSKVMNYFVEEKNAAHMMTYTDNMLGEASSFEKIGFKRIEIKTPLSFSIDATNFKKLLPDDNKYQHSYVFTNLGNTKWVKYYSTQLL